MPRLRVYHCSSFSEAIRGDPSRFARSEAATKAAAVAAADSPRHRDRGSESPLFGDSPLGSESPELDGRVASANAKA